MAKAQQKAIKLDRDGSSIIHYLFAGVTPASLPLIPLVAFRWVCQLGSPFRYGIKKAGDSEESPVSTEGLGTK